MGKVMENLMVDLRPSNAKLRDRAARVVAMLVNCSRGEAETLLETSGGDVRKALEFERIVPQVRPHHSPLPEGEGAKHEEHDD
jgi:N-acetylmuramic acid 6-phosphate etherase